jgi:hypothetical protein
MQGVGGRRKNFHSSAVYNSFFFKSKYLDNFNKNAKEPFTVLMVLTIDDFADGRFR